MKRRAAAIAVISVVSGAALAIETVTYNGQVNGGGGWTGGVFEMSSDTGIAGTTVQAGDTFFTFCIELDEFIGGGTFEVQTNTSAISGSGNIGADTDANVGDGMDELDYRTAYLYTTHLGAALGDSDTARALQMAIWSIEEGIDVQTYVIDGIDQGIRDDADAFISESWDEVFGVGGSWGQTWGDVRVLNIGGDAINWRKQDMLVIIPLPQTGVLAGIGLTGIVIRRRRLAC